MSNTSTNLLLYPEWHEEYKAAMLELDRSKLLERIVLARKAISERMNVFVQDHFGTSEERDAITDALNGLAMLEQEFEKSA